MKKYPIIRVLIPTKTGRSNKEVATLDTIPEVKGWKVLNEKNTLLNRAMYRELQLIPEFATFGESGNAVRKPLNSPEVKVHKAPFTWGNQDSLSADTVSESKEHGILFGANASAHNEIETETQSNDVDSKLDVHSESLLKHENTFEKELESQKSWFSRLENRWLKIIRPVIILVELIWMLPILVFTVWPRIIMIVKFRRLGKKLKKTKSE